MAGLSLLCVYIAGATLIELVRQSVDCIFASPQEQEIVRQCVEQALAAIQDDTGRTGGGPALQ